MRKIVNKIELDELLKGDKKKLFILDFNAPWCGPCRVMKNIFKGLSDKDLKGAELVDIDVDEATELSEEYNIRTIPLILFVKDGMILDRINGSTTKEAFLAKVKVNNEK